MINKNYSISIINFIFFLIFIIIPLELMVSNSQSVPKIIDAHILVIYLINVFILFTLVYFICNKIKFFLEKKFIINFAIFILIWITLNGLLAPTIGGKIDFWEQSFFSFRLRHIIIFKLIFSLLLTITVIRLNLLNIIIKFISYFLIIIFCINIYILFNNFLIFNKNSEFALSQFNIGKNNILTISFDGINGNIISELINIDDNKDVFKDFDLYSNYTVTFPATKYSISSELTHQTDLENVTNDDLIINQNKNNLKNIYTYGAYNSLFLGENKISEGQFNKNNNSVKLNAFFQTVLFPSTSRWATYLSFSFYENYLRNSKHYGHVLSYLSFNFFKDDYSFFNDHYRISSIEVLEIFNKKNYKKIDTNNAYFFHFNFSHWYILFDENCNYIPINSPNNLQNYEGNIKNTKCVLKKMKSIIKTLKDNDIYNENTIIFKSDHGKPIGFHKSNFYNQGINENIRWGIGRYNSFFMIKENKKSQKSIKVIEKNTGAKFLYEFYCNNLPFHVKCTEKNVDKIYIPLNKTAFLNLDDFKKIDLRSFVSLDF